MASPKPYVAFLRGVNVGGKGLLKMSELKAGLEADGFKDVRTYIQSGNVLFKSGDSDTAKLAKKVSRSIGKYFGMTVGVAVFSDTEWRSIVAKVPSWWESDPASKYNLIILIPPYEQKQVIEAIGELKSDLEKIEPGKGVLYQSLSIKKFGQTTGGKINRKPVYQQMTIRNPNTARKLMTLLGT